jgi:predicted amidohydrolase YtcJ
VPVERLAADLIVTNARVRTMDASGSVVQAVAVKNGRIIGTGSDAEVESLADARTERLDAGGQTVLPGFIDGHTHFQSAAIQRAFLIDFMEHEPHSIHETLELVRKRALPQAPGTWIRGDGLADGCLEERRFPNRWEIDEVAPDHPTVLLGIGKHVITANSLALQLAGIDRDTEDPPGGAIDRDADGEPTGVLRERGKLRLDPAREDTVLPTYGIDERREALRQGFQYLNSFGVTTIHDITVDPIEVRTYHEMRRLGELHNQRLNILIRGVESQTPLEDVIALGLQQGLGDEWLKLNGIKMSIDGAGRQSAVYEHHPGEPENFGLIRIPKDELDEKVMLCHNAGLRVALHAIGQKAVDMAMDAIEAALVAEPRRDHRHRIEHATQPPRPGQLERMARLEIVASPQAAFLANADRWMRNQEPGRLVGYMPLRSMHDVGLRVMGSTDFPCVDLNPFLGLKCAVARLSREGTLIDPGQALSLDEALRLQTTGAAFGGFEEHLKGSLEPGKLADLIVISEDPYAVPPAELDRIQVELTIVGGRVVYQRQEAALTAV